MLSPDEVCITAGWDDAQLGLEDMQSNIASFCNIVKRITEPENWNKTVGQLLASEESEEKLETSK